MRSGRSARKLGCSKRALDDGASDGLRCGRLVVGAVRPGRSAVREAVVTRARCRVADEGLDADRANGARSTRSEEGVPQVSGGCVVDEAGEERTAARGPAARADAEA